MIMKTTPVPSSNIPARIAPLVCSNTPATGQRTRHVIKRNGQQVRWDRSRIVRALTLAYTNTPTTEQVVTAPEFQDKIARLAEGVEWALWHRFPSDQAIPIESIQDVAETCLAAAGDWEVARAYVRYRTQRAERRPRRFPENGLIDFIAVSRYARFNPELGRREIWSESVQRVRDMHLRRFASRAAQRPNAENAAQIAHEVGLTSEEQAILAPDCSLFEAIWECFDDVADRRVLPSMRSLQFGGQAIEANEARIYNCSFSHANRTAFFRECFFLLLSGVGVGFSVQHHHVNQLPVLPERASDSELPVNHVTVADSIEGWSDAVDALVRSHYDGWLIEFNYSEIRPRGAPLVTSGGKAPGHLPLKRCLKDIAHVLRAAAGRRLRPIEVYDIVMYIARAVLAGGIRRSATLCLFSPNDEEMANAKTGDWLERNPQRAYSNNSALLVRRETDRETFVNLFERIRESGEPGFYFAEDAEYGANPCVEIGLCPRAVVNADDVKRLRALGYKQPLEPGDAITGWQMCNLSTVNCAAVETPGEFLSACRTAALIGTLQAAYTNIEYLGPVTQFLNEREALLGVSLCGVLDRPALLLNPAVLESGARVVRATNALFATMLGRRPGARTTCVKPEGTASLLLGAGSGIHPHHAPRYFRRVQVNRLDPVYRHFREHNAHLTEASVYNPQTDDVVTFPVEAPPGALCRDDIDAQSFLKLVLLVQRHWVQSGRAHEDHNAGLHHNVSNTVSVRDDEWQSVATFIWENRDQFTGVALLGHFGDKQFPQAPREAIAATEDIARWNQLEYQPVDYRQMSEKADHTRLADVAACAGGTCEW